MPVCGVLACDVALSFRYRDVTWERAAGYGEPAMSLPRRTPAHRSAHARPGHVAWSGRGVVTLSVKAATVAGLLAAGAVGISGGADLESAGAASGASVLPAPSVVPGTASAVLLDRTQLPERAARSAVRSAVVAAGSSSGSSAVTAPEAPAPVHQVFGVSGVTAVAKPKPKPKPAPVATNDAGTGSSTGSAATGSSGSSGSGGGSGSYSTSAFAAQGAAKGLGAHAIAVYSAVRSQFGITNIGGYRAGDPGDHGTGHACDVMITSSSQGDAVAAFVMARAGQLHVKYVIWQQRIWFPGASGWRAMEDRGSPTQNHMDHVHVSVN